MLTRCWNVASGLDSHCKHTAAKRCVLISWTNTGMANEEAVHHDRTNVAAITSGRAATVYVSRAQWSGVGLNHERTRRPICLMSSLFILSKLFNLLLVRSSVNKQSATNNIVKG